MEDLLLMTATGRTKELTEEVQ